MLIPELSHFLKRSPNPQADSLHRKQIAFRRHCVPEQGKEECNRLCVIQLDRRNTARTRSRGYRLTRVAVKIASPTMREEKTVFSGMVMRSSERAIRAA